MDCFGINSGIFLSVMVSKSLQVFRSGKNALVNSEVSFGGEKPFRCMHGYPMMSPDVFEF